MHIEVHIFPDHFPIDPQSWTWNMRETMGRVSDLIIEGTVNKQAYALGKTTLLANDDSGMIVATVDIRRE